MTSVIGPLSDPPNLKKRSERRPRKGRNSPMVSRSTTSTSRNPLSARFLRSSHPMPPDPMSRILDARIDERRSGPRADRMPRRIGGTEEPSSGDGDVMVLGSGRR